MIINQNIAAVLRKFSNLQKRPMKHFTTWRQFPKLLLLNFLQKFLTEEKTSNEQFNPCKVKISLAEFIKSLNS